MWNPEHRGHNRHRRPRKWRIEGSTRRFPARRCIVARLRIQILQSAPAWELSVLPAAKGNGSRKNLSGKCSDLLVLAHRANAFADFSCSLYAFLKSGRRRPTELRFSVPSEEGPFPAQTASRRAFAVEDGQR